MTGEQMRRRGLAVAAAGVVLVAWVIVFAATTEAGNPPVLLAASLAAGLVCLCLAGAGSVAARIGDAAAAARLRHVLVVLEGAVLALVLPVCWSALNVEDTAGEFTSRPALALCAPVAIALVLVVRLSRTTHRVVADAYGPVVAGSGDGDEARRVRVLGTVLVVAGAGLSISAAVVVSTVSSPLAVFLLGVVLVTLTPVLLGLMLTRVKDVYSARRRSAVIPFAITSVVAISAGNFAFKAEAATTVALCALMVGAIALQVTGYLALREYTGVYDRPFRVSR
ncbi:MAG: hypothetical protein QOF58_3216 [Pseudonocardiales bacterium]|nr:hypothetical protein [Pseudonocardiales bacterium]